MNKILATAATVLAAMSAQAASLTDGAWPAGSVTAVNIERSASALLVSMDIHTDFFTSASNRETWMQPAITAGADTLWLDPVVVAGRTRYYQHQRCLPLPENATMLRAGASEVFSYTAKVPYQDWMELSELIVTGRIDGCCGANRDRLGTESLKAMDYRDKTIVPVMVYVSPAKEFVKMRAVSGQAYIDFPVNETQIIPDYRRNPFELAEIMRTIDEVRNDRDITITDISFTGYASPEGSYELNEKLAKGRTEALIEYVRRLYKFPRDVMHSSWVAEDWSGLEKHLAGLDIADRKEILAIVTDYSLAPDAREWRLKSSYPEQYAYLLVNVYPALRHSDYKVTYQVRNYVDAGEIGAIMATAPQKLSLDELFLYAKSLDKDSPEFREVMEVAVRMYPDDPEANLNAAATAVSFGDYNKAREYLRKAGSSPVATYTEGVIEAKQGNYSAAAVLLQEASRGGVAEAADLLGFMKRVDLID